MNKRFIKIKILAAIFSLTMLAQAGLANASIINTNAKNQIGNSADSVSGVAGYDPISLGSNDLATIVGIVIQAFLAILGVIFLVYMIYAGYNWMIAQGDEEKVTKAKETIQRAVIGLIVIIAAYAISAWVFDKLLTNTQIIS